MEVVHVEKTLVDEYLTARKKRREVCDGNCHMFAEGECGYSARERIALDALLASLAEGT